MSEREDELARETIEETGQNPTQESIGEGEEKPVDVSWDERKVGGTPHKGETDATA